jgi:hypothetical protein
VGLVWWNWDDIAKRPGVESFLAYFNQKPVPAAPAERLTMAVAHLARDKDREHERLLLDELRQFEGVEAISVDRTVEPEQPDKKKAEEEARDLLKKTGADVLVWGSVISLGGKSAMRLYWTPARVSMTRSKWLMELSKNFARRTRPSISKRPSASGKQSSRRNVNYSIIAFMFLKIRTGKSLNLSQFSACAKSRLRIVPRAANVCLRKPSIVPKCFT